MVVRRPRHKLLALSFAVVLAGCAAEAPLPKPSIAAPKPALPAPAEAAPSGAAKIAADAYALMSLADSLLAQSFLAHASLLPKIAPRTLYHDAEKKRFLDEEEYKKLADRAGFSPMVVDEEIYYNTKYGSPLAYMRALDVLGEAGVTLEPGARFFDFGYGGVGHLRVLASLGLEVTGVDVDPLLAALYSRPEDQGVIAGASGQAGFLRLLNGHWPGEPSVWRNAAGPFDVIVSKNVLKKGYIHPDRPADERKLIKLGVDDTAFLGAIYAALKPGGFFLIYNICPALSPPDKPFIPWSDGRSPFSRESFEAAGLRVQIFDRDDTEAIRVIGHKLGWDQGEDAMDLENNLSVLYTLVERPLGPRAAQGVL